MLFATKFFLTNYQKEILEVSKKGIVVVIIATALHVFLPGYLITKILVISLFGYAFVLLGMAMNLIITLVKISVKEKHIAKERAINRIIPQVGNLIERIKKKSSYVDQQAKTLLGFIYNGLNNGADLVGVNIMLAKVSIDVQLRVEIELKNKDTSLTWVKPESATLVLYQSKKSIARLVMFEM